VYGIFYKSFSHAAHDNYSSLLTNMQHDIRLSWQTCNTKSICRNKHSITDKEFFQT